MPTMRTNANAAKFLFFILFFLSAEIVFCQDAVVNDAGLWQNFYVEKKISKQFAIHQNELLRFDQNFTHFDYIYTDWGVTYKPARWIHFSVDYVYIFKQVPLFYSNRHQFYADAVLAHHWNRFKFSLRSMLQPQYNDVYDSPTGFIPNWFWRNKFTLKADYYNFTPYLAYEIYYQFWNPNPIQNTFTRNRYFAGVSYPLNSRNIVELYYCIEQNFNIGRDLNKYVIGIGYEWDL